MKRKIVILIPSLDERYRKSIRAAAEKHGFETLFYDREEEALPALADAEILFTQSAFLADRAPALRWLCTPSAGVDMMLDVDGIRSGRVMLSNSSGAYGVTIAEHVIMITLEMLRRQQDYNDIVARREWIRSLPVRSVKDSRITLLGTGDLGRETARRLRAFGPESLIGVNRSGKAPNGLFDCVYPQDHLDCLLPETDILILTLPGTPETVRMLDARRLSLLPDESLVVNVGRGTVIDQAALEAELRAGRLRAALDVFEQEPVPPGASLWTCPNLLMGPHVAGDMSLPWTRERIVSLFLEDFENYCAGRPLLRLVDPARGY